MTEEIKKFNKPRNRDSINIKWARDLTSEGLEDILQHELLRARSSVPPKTEVSLPTTLVHEIKHRICRYAELHGELDHVEGDE